MGINELWLFELSESLPNHMKHLIFLHDEISIRCSAESLHVHWIITFTTVCFIYFGTRLVFVALVGYLKIISYSKCRTPLVVTNYQIFLIFWDQLHLEVELEQECLLLLVTKKSICTVPRIVTICGDCPAKRCFDYCDSISNIVTMLMESFGTIGML